MKERKKIFGKKGKLILVASAFASCVVLAGGAYATWIFTEQGDGERVRLDCAGCGSQCHWMHSVVRNFGSQYGECHDDKMGDDDLDGDAGRKRFG
jgi:hypothetical protein